MEKSESIINLIPAVIEVMKAVKNIEKNMKIGTGTNSYAGVADKDVKVAVGEAMENNGLCIFPIGIEENTETAQWEETNQYGTKLKQSYFTKVKMTYRLCHISGEWMNVVGYGHGVDSQDKAAGKATTYALKYALLYTFMIPTGKIDDADNTHSEDVPVLPKDTRKTLTPDMITEWGNVVKALATGYKLTEIEKKWKISDEHKKQLSA